MQFDTESTTAEAQAIAQGHMGRVALPDGYRWSLGEWGRSRDETPETMWNGVPVSLLVVVLLMDALFESLTQAPAILINLQFTFFGALCGR